MTIYNTILEKLYRREDLESGSREMFEVDNFCKEYGVRPYSVYFSLSQFKWDIRFLCLAFQVAQWSKNNGTKIGSILVNDRKRVIATGYNGFPQGLDDSQFSDKEKHQNIIHAELNAILNCDVSTAGSTMYSWPWPPCSQCAGAIINAGITRLVTVTGPISDTWSSNVLSASCNMVNVGIVQQYYDRTMVEEVILESVSQLKISKY